MPVSALSRPVSHVGSHLGERGATHLSASCLSPPHPACPVASCLQICLRDLRLNCGFLLPLRPPRSCPPLAVAVVSRLAKRPASAGLALTRRTRRTENIEQRGGREITSCGEVTRMVESSAEWANGAPWGAERVTGF